MKYAFALVLASAVALAAPAEPYVAELGEATNSTVIEDRAKTCCGVYICEGEKFDGTCYWGCYEPGQFITPDNWWKNNAGSFGPDVGCACYPENKARTYKCTSRKGAMISKSPGGNLGRCINNFGGFHCERN